MPHPQPVPPELRPFPVDPEILRARQNGHDPKPGPVSFGSFLARSVPPDPPPVIETFLPALDHGFIGGEEKLGKSMYMLYEALCLALGVPLFGQFRVDKPHRILLIIEDDTAVRIHRRARAMLAGMGLDPNEASVIIGLNERLMIAPQCRLKFTEFGRLETWLQQTRPELVYGDALYTLAGMDLMDTREATMLTECLTDLGLKYGVAFRLVHHFAKGSGRRRGRGSQELAGPYPLRAWAVQSLFFDALRGGETRLSVQSKDQATPATSRLTWSTEGPLHAPTVIRLGVQLIGQAVRASVPGSDSASQLLATLTELQTTEPLGVTIPMLKAKTEHSNTTLWRLIQDLKERASIHETPGRGKTPARYRTAEPGKQDGEQATGASVIG